MIFTDSAESYQNNIRVCREHDLWHAWLHRIVDDAIGSYFHITDLFPDRTDQVYQKHRLNHLGTVIFNRHTSIHIRNARAKLELYLDPIIEMLGYDESYADRIFDLVQKCITYEKRLFDEFKSQGELEL